MNLFDITIKCQDCKSTFSNEYEEYAEPQIRSCPYCLGTKLEVEI